MAKLKCKENFHPFENYNYSQFYDPSMLLAGNNTMVIIKTIHFLF